MKFLKVEDLYEMISEVTNRNEFDPKIGYSKKEEKKMNDDSYSESGKKFKEYYSGVKGEKKAGFDNEDYANRGMGNIEYDSASEEFLDKVESQIKGYVSSEAEKLHKDDDKGGNEFGDAHLKHVKKQNADIAKSRNAMNTSGLKGKELAKKGFYDDGKKMVGEGKIRRLTFKRSEFINESHMSSMIPDEYKKNGSRFAMVDGIGNEYIVEWTDRGADVLRFRNESKAVEAMEKMKHLWEYDSSKYYSTSTRSQRSGEDETAKSILSLTREASGQK